MVAFIIMSVYTLSNKLSNEKASNFITILPQPLVLPNGTGALIKLEQLHLNPWPKAGEEPLIIACNLCEYQVLGSSYERVLSVVSENKFSKPNIQARSGHFQSIEVKALKMNGELADIKSVTVQISIVV